MSDSNLDALLFAYQRYMAAEGKSRRTIESTLACVRGFAAYLGEPLAVDSVTASQLREYILHLQSRPKWVSHPTISADKGSLSPFTIATHVRTIKAFWSWLEREEFVDSNPLSHVPTPKTPICEVRTLSPEECRALVAAIPTKGFVGMRDRALVLALMGMGARITEVTSLKIPDVDFETGQIRVLGKGQKERRLFMSPNVFKAMHKYWLKERQPVEGEYFFTHKNGRPLDRWYVNHQFHKYSKQAGLRDRSVSPHKLRHTYATEFLRDGGDVFTLQKVLGHSTLDMSRHYAQIANDDVERSMRAHSPVERLKLKV